MTRLLACLLISSLLWATGCESDDSSGNNGLGIDPNTDASTDGSTQDSGQDDAGQDDAGQDDAGQDDAGTAQWSACSAPTDCILVADSCCGVCGQPQLSDMDAVNKNRTDEHFDSVCPEPQMCPDCPSATNPSLVATCSNDTCQGYDVRQEPFTECSADSDCRLRVRECCECGGTTDPSQLIAVSDGAAYASLVCGSNVGCPECAPTYPDNATARCNDDGHCEVEVN